MDQWGIDNGNRGVNPGVRISIAANVWYIYKFKSTSKINHIGIMFSGVMSLWKKSVSGSLKSINLSAGWQAIAPNLAEIGSLFLSDSYKANEALGFRSNFDIEIFVSGISDAKNRQFRPTLLRYPLARGIKMSDLSISINRFHFFSSSPKMVMENEEVSQLVGPLLRRFLPAQGQHFL